MTSSSGLDVGKTSAVLGRASRQAREVRFGTRCREDTTDRVQRHSARDRAARGTRKPRRSQFLGFTHICAKSPGNWGGSSWKTITQNGCAPLLAVDARCGSGYITPFQNRVAGSPASCRALQLLRGARRRRGAQRLPLPGHPALARMASATRPKHRMAWTRMDRLADRWLPLPRILHPWPRQRFAAIHPRQEPVR